LSGVLKIKNRYKKSKSCYSFIKIIFVSGIIAAAGCGGCDKSTKSDIPEVYNLQAPDSLVKGLPDTTIIYLSVRDPQGLEDIDSVFFTVNRPDGSLNETTFYMFDDGVNGGDSIEGDGVYTQGIQSPANSNQTGDYTFHFKARDNDNHLSNTIDKIITAYEYDNPVIRKVIISQYDLQHEHLYVSAKVLDAQGRADIERAWVVISSVDPDSLLGEFDLNDFGNNGDSTALDSYFSSDIISQSESGYAGSYLLEFNAIDYESNSAIAVDTVIVINSPVL
jgi:hypothetical protein